MFHSRRGSESARVSAALAKFVGETVVKIATVTTVELEFATPELTGFAESNWVIMIGGERTTPVGTREAVDFSPQQNSILMLNAIYKLPHLVFISNPVDYINDLNNGTSTKAPAGFVQTSMAKAVKSII